MFHVRSLCCTCALTEVKITHLGNASRHSCTVVVLSQISDNPQTEPTKICSYQHSRYAFTLSQPHTLDPCTHGARVDPPHDAVFVPVFPPQMQDRKLRDVLLPLLLLQLLVDVSCRCYNRCFNLASGCWMISSIPIAPTFNNLFQS